MEWVLVYVLLGGPLPHRMVVPTDREINFATEAECRTAQQKVFWDKKFVKTYMFGTGYVIVPTCIELAVVKTLKN